MLIHTGIYQDWGSPTILTPPTSSSNVTPPALSSDLDIWAQDTNGNKYLIDSGRKIPITNNVSTWYSGSYSTYMNTLLSSLPTAAIQTNINVGGSIYVVQNQTKRHVPTYDDYNWLGINTGNTLTLSPTTGSEIPTGPDILRDGALFTVAGNPGLYVVNNSQSYHVPSTSIFNDYGFNWSLIHYNLDPALLTNTYPSQGELSRWVHPAGGNLTYISGKRTVTIDTSTAQQWGINLSDPNYPSMDLAPLIGAANPQPLGQFIEDTSTGGLYYGSGGSAHYIASYSTFVNLGGLHANVIQVSHDFLAATTAGSTFTISTTTYSGYRSRSYQFAVPKYSRWIFGHYEPTLFVA